MVNLERLVQSFETALAQKCPYVTPGNTSMATISKGVDCSGLFVAAYKSQGASIYHGSNTIARSHVKELEKLTKASQLVIGSAVFKHKSSGDEPSKYRQDGLGDYHHIGLVVSTKPLKIIHASSAKGQVTADTSIKNWSYCALLKAVSYPTG